MALKDFMAARGEGDEREDAGAARLPAASERRLRSVAPSTCIDSTSELKGTLRCNETLRIDGQVKGEVECDKTVGNRKIKLRFRQCPITVILLSRESTN
jgi:hypothetical protein